MIHLIRIAVGTVLLGLALPALAKDSMTESLRSLKGQEFDHAFLEHMIEHHTHGAEMAKLAQHHAQSAEIKRFAEKTATKQQEDIDKMKALLGNPPTGRDTTQHASSSGSSHHASGTAGSSSHDSGSSHHAKAGDHQQMKTQMMSKLESAQGAEFDRLFVEEMKKHHEMGIEMAQLAQRQGSREEVRAFAKKTVDEQKKESEELKRLKS